MSENEKRVPKRRFKEFQNSEGWEKCKLGDIAEIVSGGTPDTNNPDYWDGDINWYAPAEISDQIYVMESERKITELGLQKSSAKILPAEKTILFTSRAGIGKMAILRHPACTNQGFQSLVLKDGYEPYFIYSMGNQLKEKAEAIASGSTFLEISGKMLANLDIMIPNREEQIKITSYFQGLDNLIILHQRKLDKMKALKEAYLTEMFPAEGERKPKLRFAGFTDDWEQRKVKDIFKVTRGYVLAATETTNKKTGEMPYPVYSSQTKDNGLMGYYKNFLYESAITWTTDGANAGTVNYRAGKFYCTNVCGVLLSDDGYANKMVSEALNNVSWKHVSKVGNPKLMNNVMSEIVISLPKTIEEQNTISDFLNRLDNLITLHQRKLEKLQNIKKAYLNEMFI